MGPILRINGVRFAMGKLTAGTYRQVMLFGEDYKIRTKENKQKYSDVELIEDALEIIKLAFKLTNEQAQQIDIGTILPTFLEIQEAAQGAFIEAAAEVPNAEGPADYPGQI